VRGVPPALAGPMNARAALMRDTLIGVKHFIAVGEVAKPLTKALCGDVVHRSWVIVTAEERFASLEYPWCPACLDGTAVVG
jgi:hypothetical protein